MRWNWHRRKGSIFKSLPAVIGIALFTVQLSYKFYIFSSQPLFNPTAKAAPHKAQLTNSPAIAARTPWMSLDKRYDLKHVFALLPSAPWHHYLPVLRLRNFHPQSEDLVHITIPPAAGRGPPVFCA